MKKNESIDLTNVNETPVYKPIHNLKGNIFHPGVKKDNISCLSDIPKDILKKSSSSKTS